MMYRLATGWRVRGSNPRGGGDFSASVQTKPAAHPASCTMGTGTFPGVVLTTHPHLVLRLKKE